MSSTELDEAEVYVNCGAASKRMQQTLIAEIRRLRGLVTTYQLADSAKLVDENDRLREVNKSQQDEAFTEIGRLRAENDQLRQGGADWEQEKALKWGQ